MKIVAVTMVKDEADIIGRTLEHLLAEGVDEIIVADNLSTDATPEILAELAASHPITIREDAEVGYYQDRKMTRLAWIATSRHDADWVIPFDADEFWCGREGTLREAIESSPAEVLYAETLHHLPIDGGRMRQPISDPRAKVCFRWEPGNQLSMGNHNISHNGAREDGRIVIHEFQYRSFEQFVSKVRNGAAAFAATTISPTTGAHWRENGAKSDAELEATWVEYLDTPGLVPVDWQPSRLEP